MAGDDIWEDEIFASVARDRSNPTSRSSSTVSPADQAAPFFQSVGDVSLSDAHVAAAGEEGEPKFTGWDGFWSDPLFENVAGRRDRAAGQQDREFWKYELDEAIPLSSLFPSLDSDAWNELRFRKSAVEFWSRPIGTEPAGLYLRTEIELNGALDGVFQVFRTVLGEAVQPVLRLSAYLGVTMEQDQTLAIDGVSLSGSLIGLRTPLPPVLELVTILSVGLRLNVGSTTNVVGETSTVQTGVFGDLQIQLPGLTGSLQLEYEADLSEDWLELSMTIPGNKKWENALGADSFHLDEVRFFAKIPLHTAAPADTTTTSGDISSDVIARPDPQALLSIAATARWKGSDGADVGLKGVIVKGRPDLSFLEGHMEKVTWSDIKRLFSDVHGRDLDDTEHEITCENLTVRISQAQFLLQGSLTINGRALAKATIAITRAGIAITAEVDKWEVGDGLVVIEQAALTLLVGSGGDKDSGAPRQPEDEPPTKKRRTTGGPEKEKKGWSGSLEVTGRVLIHTDGQQGKSGQPPVEVDVTLAMGKQNQEWFWVVCGHLKADLSLSRFVSAIDEDSDIDLRLKEISLIASSTNRPACSLDTNGYTIQQGRLEQVPLLQMGDMVKKPAAGDQSYLSLGWAKGSSIPSVSIYLPESLKIELGPRFRSRRFQLSLGSSATGGVAFAFRGIFDVKVGDDNSWYKFDLKMAVDPIGADGELFFDGNINNPFGLCKRLTIGPRLGIGLKFNWAQLAASGLPVGAGIKGSLYLDDNVDKPYDLVLYICEDPRDMVIKAEAPAMDYTEIIQFVAAAMDTQIPTTDVTLFRFQDVLIYASMGATFGGEHYPAGFRFKGGLTICDHEAAMDASLTTEGLRLKAWLQTFRLGPLSVGGDVVLPGKEGTFALLDMELTRERQAFVLNGFVELFDLRAAVDVHIQLLPAPIFYFTFEMQWSTLLAIKAKAEMIGGTKLMCNPREASWEVSAEFEQTIIQEMARSLERALKAVHEKVEAKINGAKQAVADAERVYKEKIAKAQAALEEERAKYQAENDRLDQELDRLERETQARSAVHRDAVFKKKKEESSAVAEAETVRDHTIHEASAEVQEKERALNNEESRGTREHNDAISDRERRRQEFMAKFGDAEAAVRRARDNVANAKRSVENLRSQIDNLENRLSGLRWFQKALALDTHLQIAALGIQYGTAKVGLGVADGALELAQKIMQSQLFHDLTQALHHACEAVETIKRQVDNAINAARDHLHNAQKLLDVAKSAAQGKFDEARRQAREMVDTAQKIHDDYVEKQEKESKKLRIQLQQLKNSGLSAGVSLAEGVLEAAKNNNAAFLAAQAGLDAVKVVEGAIYDTLRTMIEAAATLCDIRVVRLRGTITAKPEEQSAFQIYLEGTLVGQDFKFDLVYYPGKTIEFLEGLAKEAMGHLKLT
ncbi:ATP-binding protein [Aspergillus aculeatinus CBS 121060]|uniref:Uncharacterized protein n=1 Tax=Aspergillus aculeatinus CBS 121060 TaxID=1448322 RepID=A0ACD1H4J2_9EURO|nr:hypothetical protein BO66DRAFT_440043 [Aspergillus aculeatinus CBS 121060]RAH68427.1 hypothetical protein BO66DRAFT_440043 [Aspergillus aculeatinus CBS 121060]